MQVVTYRKANCDVVATTEGREGNIAPLGLGSIYPEVTKQDQETWKHWLPTLLTCNSSLSPDSVILTQLRLLDAPSEVMEEFRIAWNLELFEEYQIRHSISDPILIGRSGDKLFLLALWGESLIPMESIKMFVQKSLDVRRRSARLSLHFLPLAVIGLVGSLCSISLGLFPNEFDTLQAFIAAVSLVVTAWFTAHTPKVCQQRFLDHYRR